jgi:glycosyltransferase involved in cell wall biosynthesis
MLVESDIIHGFDFLTLYAVQRLLYESKLHPPLIYSLTGCYKLHIEYLLNSGVASFLNMGKPAFIFKFLCPNRIFKRLFNSFDKIVSTCDFMVDDLCIHGISREKIEKISIGIDIEQFDKFNNETRQMPTSYDFLYFGWGSSTRGVPDVVKAFSMVLKERPNAKLALFFLGSHGIEERWYGYLIQKRKDFGSSIMLSVGAKLNILDIVKSSNAVVLPFRSPFGYSHPPLTVLESMLLKKPVISTCVGSIPEIISEGEMGFLVRPRDVNALAQKMLLTYDKELTSRIGTQAREHVIKMHNIKEVAKKTRDVYNEVINGG